MFYFYLSECAYPFVRNCSNTKGKSTSDKLSTAAV
ncbi:hypothetical protein T03_7629 [Trichinella britovi]|uniref:Uncharacterized protein n=1 Tax=Trichinella britovi TaxID=45882 RepID=A0A0V0YU45_TRIBR|nr:hypothetical protein T03_7629 [Trichinella britovi]KRZ63660.1 hypothetical protein T08_2808 [Trichinella sp. T8]